MHSFRVHALVRDLFALEVLRGCGYGLAGQHRFDPVAAWRSLVP